MAMSFGEVAGWVEKHPGESVLIGGGGVLILLWLLGYFSGSSSSSGSGSSNLASAYYAAEAQQAVVGGQIQMTTLNDAAQTAQVQTQANAAVAINAAQYGAATTINGQNADAAQTINSQDVALGATQSNNQLQATYSSNAAAVATTQSNNDTASNIALTQANASILSQYLGSIIAPETMGGAVNPSGTIDLLGGGSVHVQGASQAGTPSFYQAAGYTPSQIANIFGAGVAYPGTVN